jgi:hypothetical protein
MTDDREKVQNEITEIMRRITPHMNDAALHVHKAMEEWVRMPTKEKPLSDEERAKAMAMLCVMGEVVVRAMANGTPITTTVISTLPLLALVKKGSGKERELAALLLEELGKAIIGTRFVPPVVRNNPHTKGRPPITRRFKR